MPLFRLLQTELPRLLASGRPFQIEINGKGSSIAVKITEHHQLSTKMEPAADLPTAGPRTE